MKLTEHELYKTWEMMRARCNNPNAHQYYDYGGRGITVCSRWDDFLTFVKDMGLRPSHTHQLDRVDNNKGYCPDNCKWSTPSDNSMNKRVYGAIKFRGVCKDGAKFKAQIKVKGRVKNLGRFSSAVDAAKVYDDFIRDQCLPNKLNFI